MGATSIPSLNEVRLIGVIDNDPDIKTVNGQKLTEFTLKTIKRSKTRDSQEEKEFPEWHRVTIWQREGLISKIGRGTLLYLEGRLSTSSYEKEHRTESGSDSVKVKHYKTCVVANGEVLILNDACAVEDAPF